LPGTATKTPLHKYKEINLMQFDLPKIRQQFPALRRQTIFLDNPGGTQIAQQSIDRMLDYLTRCNSNHDGAFAASRQSDALLAETHAAVADFLNAARPEEIVFGPNMTTLTLGISRAIARTWKPGDEIVVTRLDHDANITPWTLAADDRGVTVRWVDFHPEDGTLDLQAFQAALTDKTRLVAVGYASNALGTINPLEKIISLAHAAGALAYIDAVQYAPHGPIDVQGLDCDFLVCSAYKFFGPHVGMLYGRYDLLDDLRAYKVRPAPKDPPGKFETGTQNHEGIAAVLGALEYLGWVAENFGGSFIEKYSAHYQGRCLRLKQAMAAIQEHEFNLSRALLDVLEETPGVTIYGLTDRNRLAERVPTVSFTIKGWHPKQVAVELDKAGIYVWDGNYYALAVTERLGLEGKGGMVRVGPVHYNTTEEIEKFGLAMRSIIRPSL
jgi:cysteine desulfurase family protein (TIGR01976 family)